jgi:hypothetical protein
MVIEASLLITVDSAQLTERSYKLAERTITIQEPSDTIFKCLLLFNKLGIVFN